jgi:hypothetical protein
VEALRGRSKEYRCISAVPGKRVANVSQNTVTHRIEEGETFEALIKNILILEKAGRQSHFGHKYNLPSLFFQIG